MSEPKHTLAKKIVLVVWLVAMFIIAIVKIVVGSLNVDSGCLGIFLLPYYLLLGGILALVPVALAIVTSCCVCRGQLDQMWGFMAKLFLASAAVLISGTVYILCTVARTSNLDRLCTQPWVVIAGLVILVTDWVLFALFLRLFCVVHLPPEPRDTPLSQVHVDSPFHLWKMRLNRQRL